MGLFKKKCEYCRSRIEKGNEVFRDVKIPGFTGTRQRSFCCEGCLKNYEREIGNCMKKGGRSCCG